MNIKQQITSIIEARDKATRGKDDVKLLAEALLVAVEALRFYEREHEHWKNHPMEINKAREALAEIKERLR